MSAVAIGLVTGLIAALGFGVGDFFVTKASREYYALYVVLWVSIIEAIVVLLLFIVLGWALQLTVAGIGLAFVTGVVLLAALNSAWHAFKIGPASIASAFVSGYALVTLVLSLVFLHEHLQGYQLLAVIVLIAGAVLCSMGSGFKLLQTEFWRQPNIVYALLAAVALGVSYIGFSLVVKAVGWQSAVALQAFFAVILAAILMKIRKLPFTVTGKPPINLNIVLTAGFFELGNIMTNFGFSQSLVAIVAPVISVSPLILMILAMRFLKEQLSPYQIGGIVCIVISLVVLAMR